jgi:hypothetical protein
VVCGPHVGNLCSKIPDILLKMPGLENTPLRANIVFHIFYKSLVYFVKQIISKVCVFANKIICLWPDSNTERINQNDDEQ